MRQLSIFRFILAKYRFRFWSKKRIQRYHKRKAKKLVNFAISHSRFYKTLYKNLDTTQFHTLPLITKTDMMDNFSEFNTLGVKKEEVMDFCLKMEETRDFSQTFNGLLAGLSTGTSGSRGIELMTPEEAKKSTSVFIARYPIPLRGPFHLAFILRVFSPGFNVNIGKYRVSYVSPLDTTENVVQKLNSLNPTALSAPPSMLKILAEEKESGKLNITPNIVVSYAEVLSEDVELYLEKIFKVRIHQVYKCTEGLLAIACREGSLHIAEDLTILDIVDSQGSPVLKGIPGNVIVTDLIKKTTPIMRYRLNDMVTIDPKPCSCGSAFRVIKEIKGRVDDMFLGKRKENGNPQFIFADYIRRSIVSSSENIREYRAIQTSPIEMEVLIEWKDPEKDSTNQSHFSRSAIDKIHNIFSQHSCELPNIKFQYTTIQHNFDKKLRRIVRKFNKSDYFEQQEV